MKRLVIGLGGLLGVGVTAALIGYLLLFSASPDRASRAVPAGVGLYANLYLQQSTAQRAVLYGLLGRLPGFGDPATLDTKIHQLAQRFVGEQGIDYEADLRPWLGSQLAVAVTPGASVSEPPRLLLLAAVKGPGADASVERIATRDGDVFAIENHAGVEIHISEQLSWAVIDDLLIVADQADGVRAALDADADRTPSLADSAAFAAAMRHLPADHLGSLFVDLGAFAGAGPTQQLGGYSTVVLALLAEDDGLHLVGEAPFAVDSAPAAARQAFALGRQAAGLSNWLPATTGAEVVAVGLQQSLLALEEQAAGEPALQPLADGLDQLRAVAAVGLGVNADRDLLPLLDRETALVLIEVAAGQPVPLVLLRPGDPAAAAESLSRIRDALVERGSALETRRVEGSEISVLQVPGIGQLAYAITDGVVVVATDPQAVSAVLVARVAGGSLGQADAYRDAFAAAGARGGGEAWIGRAGLGWLAELSGLDPEMRAILARIGALALTAPARDDRLELHAVVTVD